MQALIELQSQLNTQQPSQEQLEETTPIYTQHPPLPYFYLLLCTLYILVLLGYMYSSSREGKG